MAKNPLTVYLLSPLVVVMMTTSVAYGSDKPFKRFSERALIPARFAPAYNLAGADAESFATSPKGRGKISLGAATVGSSTQVGTTTYDYQHNGTMGRQIEHRGTGYLHVDWTHKESASLGGDDRGVFTQAFDLSLCPYDPSGLQFPPGGLRVDGEDCAGFVTIDVDQFGCGIPVAHENATGAYQSFSYFDYCTAAPLGLYTGDASTDNFGWWDNNGTGPNNENVWPKVAWQIGTETILHLVSTEASTDPNSSAQTCSYYRRVGPYGTDLGVWSNQRLIDTVANIPVTISAQYQGDRVAICWVAPADYKRDTPDEFVNQLEGDVWFAISTDQGADWMANPASIGAQVDQGIGNGFLAGVGGNITSYAYP